MDATNNNPRRRTADEIAFLPAALEILETPPNPIGRAVMWCAIAIVLCAVGWASFGHTDIVAVAPGKLIPSDRVKVIQPLATGQVRAIHVTDGQRVKRGDVLIELDPTAETFEIIEGKGTAVCQAYLSAVLKWEPGDMAGLGDRPLDAEGIERINAPIWQIEDSTEVTGLGYKVDQKRRRVCQPVRSQSRGLLLPRQVERVAGNARADRSGAAGRPQPRP